MLERDGELRTLERSFDRLSEGTGSVLLVEGPAGIGKTRFLAEAAERARQRNMHVRLAKGGELEREMPFGIARELFEPVFRHASAEERSTLLSGSAALAASALGRAGADRRAGPGDPVAPIHGLYWLLANLAELAPVVLAVDDAQWADAQTLRFLDYLAGRVAEMRVLVMAAARSGEPAETPELERLRLHAEFVRPRSLSEGAVGTLVAIAIGSEPGDDLRGACARATGGNPFLVAELVRALRADAIDVRSDAAASIARLGPESLARHVLLRLGRFGDDAIAVARAIAVLGGSPQLRHAAMLAQVERERARAACDRLRDAEILGPGLPIDFVHPLVRQAIYCELRDGERTQLHRRAAEILNSTGANAREIAPHLVACAPDGDQWVAARLGEAAWDAIRTGAYDSAQAYLERALAEPPDDELSVLYALGRCMLQTDPVRAADVLTAVAERASDSKVRIGAVRHAAQAYFVAGDWAKAARCHARLLESLPPADSDQRLVAEAELYVAQTASGGRTDAGSERIELVAAELEGVTPGECLARQALALDRFARGVHIDAVVGLALSFPPAVWELRTTVSAGVCKILARAGRWQEARHAITRSLESVRELGLLVNQSYYSGILAEVDRLGGRLVDAEAEARTAMEIATATAGFLNPGREALLNLIAILIARGDVAEAERLASPIDLSAGVREVHVAPWPLEVRGYLELARGRLEAGVTDLLEFGDGAESFGLLNPALFPWREEAAPALAALGRTAEAEELIVVAEARARAFGAAHVVGRVLRSRASLEPRDRQIETLKESVTALAAYGPPHELARSLLELGAALRRDRRRAEARDPLRRALDLAYRCGARGLQGRAGEELAATGARPRRAVLTGRDALTATEQRIARMAAAGLSNREIAQSLFLSPKTVENHLGRIYGKLEINSRKRLGPALAGTAADAEDGSPK